MQFKPDLIVDLEWMHRISFRLERFKTASATSHVYQCRCPLCGDSKKSQKKARFYFYTKQRQLNVTCKNCEYSRSFYNFMRDSFPSEFDEYKRAQMRARVESLQGPHKGSKNEGVPTPMETEKVPERTGHSTLDGVVPVLDLPIKHNARQYLSNRGFRQKEMSRLLWSDDFKVTADSICYEPLNEDFPSEPRIVIPFYDEEGNVEMIQGRSLSEKGLRYLSIKSHPDVDKIYGKYEVDRNITTYCVEGPFDSLFVDNCYATCDSNLSRSNADVLIFDNQPRSRELVKIMERAIKEGRGIVIWPTSPNKKRDVNDMILDGMTKKELMSLIKSNTMKGPKALLAFNRWRKV